jgi:hypothetical protein
MSPATSRRLKEGAAAGVVAGLVFAIMQVVSAVLMGQPATSPFRLLASIVLGESAFTTTTLAGAMVTGTIVHLALSALYRLVYAFISSRLPLESNVSWVQQASLGFGFGVAPWVVNFLVFARMFYPWFLDTPQPVLAILHAACFGLPLALVYASAERRQPILLRTAEEL